MGTAIVSRVAGALLALPLACLALCTLRVEPIHGWMMRHDCPFAEWATQPPSHPIGVQQGSAEEHGRAQMTLP
jgi:hypothetical protein